MTATSLLGTWVLAATGLLFLLVFVGTGYRLYRKRRRLYYKRLPRINRIMGWSRIIFVGLGLVAAVGVAMRGSNYQTFLIAPSAWAVVVIIGVTCTDFFLFGRSRYSSLSKPKVRISVCLPWILILLLLLLLTITWSAINWGQQTAAIDQRSHVFSWVIDQTFGWGIRAPYPGTYYTAPLLYCIPAVLVVGLCAIILVLIRPAWLPTPKYAALDEGFRARTIRDIVLICVGAVSPVLTMMGLDVAWAFGTLGPGSTGRAIAVAVAFFVGAWNLGQTFWVFANLIFLPPVAENRKLAAEIRMSTQVATVSIPHEQEFTEVVTPVIEAAEIVIPVIEAAEIVTPVIEAVEPMVEIAEPEVEVTSSEIDVTEVETETSEVSEVETETSEVSEVETGLAEVETIEAEIEALEAEAAEIEEEIVESGAREELVLVDASEPTESAASPSAGTSVPEPVPGEETVPTPEPAPEPEPVQESEPPAASGPVPEPEPVPTPAPAQVSQPVRHMEPKPTATHRPGFKPKKKKPRRR